MTEGTQGFRLLTRGYESVSLLEIMEGKPIKREVTDSKIDQLATFLAFPTKFPLPSVSPTPITTQNVSTNITNNSSNNSPINSPSIMATPPKPTTIMTLTIVDHFSRFVKFFPLKTKNTTHIVEKMRQYVADYGTPRGIVLDNGGEFTSTEFQQFCKSQHTTPYEETP